MEEIKKFRVSKKYFERKSENSMNQEILKIRKNGKIFQKIFVSMNSKSN